MQSWLSNGKSIPAGPDGNRDPLFIVLRSSWIKSWLRLHTWFGLIVEKNVRGKIP